MSPLLNYTPEAYEAIIAAFVALGLIQSYALRRKWLQCEALKDNAAKAAAEIGAFVAKAETLVKDVIASASKAVISAAFTAAGEIVKVKQEADERVQRAQGQVEEAKEMLIAAEGVVRETHQQVLAARDPYAAFAEREGRFVGKHPALGMPYGPDYGPKKSVQAFSINSNGDVTEVDPDTGYAIGGSISPPNVGPISPASSVALNTLLQTAFRKLAEGQSARLDGGLAFPLTETKADIALPGGGTGGVNDGVDTGDGPVLDSVTFRHDLKDNPKEGITRRFAKTKTVLDDLGQNQSPRAG